MASFAPRFPIIPRPAGGPRVALVDESELIDVLDETIPLVDFDMVEEAPITQRSPQSGVMLAAAPATEQADESDEEAPTWRGDEIRAHARSHRSFDPAAFVREETVYPPVLRRDDSGFDVDLDFDTITQVSARSAAPSPPARSFFRSVLARALGKSA